MVFKEGNGSSSLVPDASSKGITNAKFSACAASLRAKKGSSSPLKASHLSAYASLIVVPFQDHFWRNALELQGVTRTYTLLKLDPGQDSASRASKHIRGAFSARPVAPQDWIMLLV